MVLGRLAKPLAPLLPATSPDPGGATFLRRLRAMLDAVPDQAADAVAGRPAADLSGAGPAAQARGADAGLRPAGAGARGQRGHGAAADPARHRGGERRGLGLLRLLGAACRRATSRPIELAKRNIAAWLREIDGAGLDAIVINASGCGTTVKDYGHMLADDPVWQEKAKQVAALARDVTEIMAEVGLANVTPRPLTVAYHSACSMQHGQKLIELPKKLLRDAGFVVKDVPEGHLCCGWAGTYQVLQPDLSRRLRDRKVANIESVRPDVIAAGQLRLHRQYRLGHRHSDGPYGRAARLGDRRPEAGGADT